MMPFAPDAARSALPNRPRQSGMTLIEVLVAILIFSFGLLGLAGLQVRAIRFSASAEDTNRAALLANQMAFAIVNSGKTDQKSDNADAYAAWQTLIGHPESGGLPNGVGTVAPVDASTSTITISWQPTSAVASSPGSVNRYVTQVVLP